MSLVKLTCLRRIGARIAVLALLGALWASASVQAGYSDVVHLPAGGKRIRHNARLEVESRWVSGNGYRPVKVTIVNSPAGPTTYDRDFRVRLTPRTYYGAAYIVQTEAIIEMPEGARTGSAWVALPQTHGWQSIDIEVREGGQRIDELSERNMTLNQLNGYAQMGGYTESMPSVLFIDSDTPSRQMRDSLVAQFRSGTASITNPTYDLPDLRTWQMLVPQVHNQYAAATVAAGIPGAPATNVARAHDVEILSIVAQNEKSEILPFEELPDHWLHYTCLDLIVLTLDDALKLQEKFPAQWEAISRWAATGPTLVISGVGDDFQRLAQLEKLLKLPSHPVRAEDLEDHGGWTKAKSEYAYSRVRAIDSVLNVNNQVYDANGNLIIQTPQVVDADQTPFAVRSFVLGRVVATKSADPLETPAHQMSWVLNQLESRNWMSYQRHGISFSRQNSDFMTFLIEGTGQVPVWSFLVLISGFVVVIGPVNYLFLKRWRRLFLLLVTVPAGAAVITVSLFGYALISDGLGVRMRARSYSRLDQRTERMANWSRQSYYAGLAPSGGLRFPADSAVYPIDEYPFGGGGGRQRELAWSDDTQQLRSGYISSRQTAQFLLLNSSPSQRKLEIKPAQGNAPPQITNRLEANVLHLLLRDHDGKYFELHELEPGASKPLSASTYTKALKPFSLAYNERRPALPLGYNDSEWGGGLFGFTNNNRNRYYYDRSFERGLSQPTFNTSILETELRRSTMNNTEEIPPGTYLALLEQSPDMPVGYRRVREVGSFHVLEGKW